MVGLTLVVYILGLSRFSLFCFDDEKRIGRRNRVVERGRRPNRGSHFEVWENISHETESEERTKMADEGNRIRPINVAGE